MPGPIRPEEVESAMLLSIPEEVFTVFNELILRNIYNGTATVKQDDVVAALVQRGYERHEIFAQRWLDVESAYRAIGWIVEYDKPAYNETYAATFKFTKRLKR